MRGVLGEPRLERAVNGLEGSKQRRVLFTRAAPVQQRTHDATALRFGVQFFRGATEFGRERALDALGGVHDALVSNLVLRDGLAPV